MILFLLFALGVRAEDCIRNDQVESLRACVSKVADFTDSSRRTEEEFASDTLTPLGDVQKRFAATGKLICPSGISTAQLTGANDVITTVAHALNSESCAKAQKPESCRFEVTSGEEVASYGVKKTFKAGYACGEKRSHNNDWAVLQLDKPVAGAEFYELPSPQEEIGRNDEITSVSAGSVDFVKLDKNGKKYMPKSIVKCEVRRANALGGELSKTDWFESNCGVGAGNSGGSVIRDRKTLLGITVGHSYTKAEAAQEARSGVAIKKDYEAGKWTSLHISLKGAFLKAVEEATGGRSI